MGYAVGLDVGFDVGFEVGTDVGASVAMHLLFKPSVMHNTHKIMRHNGRITGSA